MRSLKKIERWRYIEQRFLSLARVLWKELEDKLSSFAKADGDSIDIVKEELVAINNLFLNWFYSNVEAEEWKDTFIYPDSYEVSNKGRVRSKDREIINPSTNTGTQKRKGKILKQTISTKGYPQVGLSANGKRITINVHKLVAVAFLPDPGPIPEGEKYWEVNHKFGDKLNPDVANLEWETGDGNRKHAVEYGLRGSKYGRDIEFVD